MNKKKVYRFLCQPKELKKNVIKAKLPSNLKMTVLVEQCHNCGYGLWEFKDK